MSHGWNVWCSWLRIAWIMNEALLIAECLNSSCSCATLQGASHAPIPVLMTPGDGPDTLSRPCLAMFVLSHVVAAVVLPGLQAPEIMIKGHVSKSADVYALGMVLWELLHR